MKFFVKIITICLINCPFLFSQEAIWEVKKMEVEFDDTKQSMSGIIYFDNHFYLPTERCRTKPENYRKVLKKSKSNPDNFEWLYLKGINKHEQIEGITQLESQLFLVGEYGKVYAYNMKKRGKTNALKLDLGHIYHRLKEDEKAGGIEGIAVNAKTKDFFFLLEHDSGSKNAYLFAAKLSEDERGFVGFKSFKLPLPKVKKGEYKWRYSDIYFDISNSRLIGLKTRIGEYHIEEIPVFDGLPNINEIRLLKDISRDVLKYEDDYSTNMEGITLDSEGNVYLVSDNYIGRANCESGGQGKTLLLKYTLKRVK